MDISKQNNQEQKLVRSFGRIKSRKLSDKKQDLLQNSYPKFSINSDKNHKISDYKNYNKRSFEIGFGFGDFMFEKAKDNPAQLFFGAEPHINGVVNVLAKIEDSNIDNVRISMDDARILLEKFEDGFFDEFYILFPDPWPKAKHFKRRIITAKFLDDIVAKKLKKGGKLTIATDHDSYKAWICSEILKSDNFLWQCESKKDWQNFPDDWVITKYQKKALQEGRVSVIYNLLNV